MKSSGSALTGDGQVPKGRAEQTIARDGVPSTYVPARNTVLLSLALAWAEVLGARDLFLGVNAIDYSGYPDCRPEFLRAFEGLAGLATAAGTEGGRATPFMLRYSSSPSATSSCARKRWGWISD